MEKKYKKKPLKFHVYMCNLSNVQASVYAYSTTRTLCPEVDALSYETVSAQCDLYYSFMCMHINTKYLIVNLDVQAGTVSDPTTSSQSHQAIFNQKEWSPYAQPVSRCE